MPPLLNESLPEHTLAHFSDIHVAQKSVWAPADFFSKRLTGWMNWKWFGRGKRFQNADKILTALRKEWQSADHVVFSGDATALGFEGEFQEAARLLGLSEPGLPPGLAVPGNHDLYTRKSQKLGLFEKHFAHWQQGIRIGNHCYPFAQRMGNNWLIGVNTAKANILPWDARGKTGKDQLDRLEKLIQTLGPGTKILVTHYPVLLPTGKGEKRNRALRDLEGLVEIVRGKIALWLHGHRHDSYHVPPSNRYPFHVLCAGSATQKGQYSYWRLRIKGRNLKAQQKKFHPEDGQFHIVQDLQHELLE